MLGGTLRIINRQHLSRAQLGLDLGNLVLRQLSQQDADPRDWLTFVISLAARFDARNALRADASAAIRQQHTLPNSNDAAPLLRGENEAPICDSEGCIEKKCSRLWHDLGTLIPFARHAYCDFTVRIGVETHASNTLSLKPQGPDP